MIKHVQKPIDELALLQGKSTPQFTGALLALARATFLGDMKSRERSLERLRELLARTMTAADLLGRKRMLMEADRVRNRTQPPAGLYRFEDRPSESVPTVPNVEAIEDIVSREPRLAHKAETIWDLYRRRHAFVLARSADIEVTKAVQRAVAQGMRDGEYSLSAPSIISKVGDWSAAYGRTVYRTNLATAYAAGRFKEARDPDVAEVIGGFEYNATLDPDCRPNHRAAHGLMAGTNDPIWEHYTAPMGFNCRCSMRLVDRRELEQKGLLRGGVITRKIPSGFAMAGPDKGFGGARPDRRMYS